MSREPLRRVLLPALAAVVLPVLPGGTPVRDPCAGEGLAARFEAEVRPLLARYCFRCHGPERQKGDVRFDVLDASSGAADGGALWSAMRAKLAAGEMPPPRQARPSEEERDALVAFLTAALEELGPDEERGERGPVLRRLTKAQLTSTLQELLGVGIDFGRSLPDDGKSALGFSNDGATLLASPLHLETYQEIARRALAEALPLGPRPPTTRLRVTFGRGLGEGQVAGTTGGYQAVPLSTKDFRLEVLDEAGNPVVPRDAEEAARFDHVRRHVSVGLRGSSQERFDVVPEGVVLQGALPHQEVAPGSWQGPSPNLKLELQRVFPEAGELELRVTASRGHLVRGRKQLLVALDEPEPRCAVEPWPAGRAASDEECRALAPTRLGPWSRAGPVPAASGEAARAALPVDPAALDLARPLRDGVTRWEPAGETDGEVQRYEEVVGTVLLARELEAPSPRRVELSLGSDDALRAWLDGALVLDRDVRRGVAPDQDRLSLELPAGTSRLLLEVVNFGGGFGSFQRVLHDGTRRGLAPLDLAVEPGALVLTADLATDLANLHFEDGGLLAVDFPAESEARLAVPFLAGYSQLDLVHRALPPQAMGSVRVGVDDLRLDLRPVLAPEEVARGWVATPLGVVRLDAGLHEVRLGGPFFVGFTHLVVTPLPDDHPQVARLEAQAVAEESRETPALRAYVGTRTDDGMDYATFDGPREVEAPLDAPETLVFRGRLEDLPVPEPESGDDEILSGILVIGVWNDHLVHSRRETGPPLLLRALEIAAPVNPVWPPGSYRRVFPEPPPGERAGDEEAWTRAVLAGFLPRAFRRPVEEDEVERYLAHWRGLRPDFASLEESVREVLVAALCSPSFLFLCEPERPPGVPLDAHALAARLSFFLWNGPPDDELRRLADADELRDALDAQTERLLDDPRSGRFVRAFTREWLRLDRLEGMTIDPNAFPLFTRFVKRDMEEETFRFVEHVLTTDASLFDLVDSDYALLNQDLAEFYGVQGVRGVAFRPVPLPREAGRGGLLSQGAFLAGHSDGREPHPVKRAAWVKGRLLGQPPPPPPPNVPALDADSPELAELSLKEKLERHRKSDSCRECHASFDAFGLALEGYDAVGLREAERGGRPVDDEAVLPDGTVVDGAAGLKAYLLHERREDFAAALVKHLFAYALGRTVDARDEAELALVRERAREGGDTLRAVIRAIVASPSFSGR